MTSVSARDQLTVRTQILSRYVKFFRSLLKSASPEVVSVASKMARDVSSTTWSNLHQLQRETGDLLPGETGAGGGGGQCTSSGRVETTTIGRNVSYQT